LRERRRAFKRRREGLERIQGAAGELDSRIADLEGQDRRLQQLAGRVREQLAELRQAAQGDGSDAVDIPVPSHLGSRSAAA
jgi:predicted  nucleic acid-binding Zn-ribbon protein